MGVKGNFKKKQYGDFQTPNELAGQILAYLKKLGVEAKTIIEPTCGLGAFLKAAAHYYQEADIRGIDINPDYIKKLETEIHQNESYKNIKVEHNDFFTIRWEETLRKYHHPILFLGNLPWITSSELSTLFGANIPEKQNIYEFKGISAITGKSNFDISEFMIISLLNVLNKTGGTLAFLCKASVLRKVLQYANKYEIGIEKIQFHVIDSKGYFNVSVEAGLLICILKPGSDNRFCRVYNAFSYKGFIQELGFIENNLIANISYYNKWHHLLGEFPFTWRSGIKHDCSKVMELKEVGDQLRNGYGELVEIESQYLYPLLKSSDLANNRTQNIDKWLIVPQQTIGTNTNIISKIAPQTWDYLIKYGDQFDKRGSRIYMNKPRFSIFGIGDYTFSPWKCAISGFYKSLVFQLVASFKGKPVVFDDTCYFVPLKSEEEGLVLESLLNHPHAKEFYHSFIFWDSKRPITKEILQKFNLVKLIDTIERDELLFRIRKKNAGFSLNNLNKILATLMNNEQN